MFYMSYMSPAPIAGTLRLHRKPMSLGPYTDVDGVRWDVHAILNGYVCARRQDRHQDYYSTDTGACSDGFHTWLPYRVEVVPES